MICSIPKSPGFLNIEIKYLESSESQIRKPYTKGGYAHTILQHNCVSQPRKHWLFSKEVSWGSVQFVYIIYTNYII